MVQIFSQYVKQIDNPSFLYDYICRLKASNTLPIRKQIIQNHWLQELCESNSMQMIVIKM